MTDRVRTCPNPDCRRVVNAHAHCSSPTCTWWKCRACGWVADRAGRTIPRYPK